MSDKSIDPSEDGARLSDAANCPDCKRIWARYSNAFCERHSIAGWKKQDKIVESYLTANRPIKADKQKGSVAKAKPAIRDQKIAESPSKQESSETTVPNWLKNFGIGIAAIFLLLLGLGGCFAALEALGIITPPESTDQRTESEETSKTPTFMPSITGKSYSKADELLDEICDENQCEYYDLYLDRSVWDSSNWRVVDQAPPSGTLVEDIYLVCIGIVKNDELSVQRNYKFPTACPKSNSAAVIEREKSWIPDGYEEDFDGFASDGTLRFEDCKFEGKSGRCAYYEYLTRDGLTNGAFVKVQWLNSLNEVVDVSLFTTSGSVNPGGKFEFVAFLPNSTWDKPVSPRILEISG